MALLFRITVLILLSLLMGISINQFINQGIRWPILLLALPKTEKSMDLIPILVNEAYDLLQKNEATFIDIRSETDFQIDHIPGALSLPFYQHFGGYNLLKTNNKNDIIIVYCFEPINKKAELFAEHLLKQGFSQTQILYGGFAAWIENQYPLEAGKSG